MCGFVGALEDVVLTTRERGATGCLVVGESWELVSDVDQEEVEGENEAVRVGVFAHCHHVDGVALLGILEEFGQLRGGGWTEALWRDVDVEADVTG